MRTCIVAIISTLVACGSDDGVTTASGACEGLAAEGPPLVVHTVDENGRPVAADRVVWQSEPADPFWLQAGPALCVSGDPPCSEWTIDETLPERLAVSAERTTAAAPSADCLPYASAFAVVHASNDGERQLLELTLPGDGTYCVEGTTGRTVLNVQHDEVVGAEDCLVAPPPVEGPIQLVVRNQDGDPVPAAIANWYYPPEGPDFDGEHPMACADLRCERWVARETPRPGTIYLNASYSGPLNPFVQQGWSDYNGAPFEVELDDAGAIVPIAAELSVDTMLEGAIGG